MSFSPLLESQSDAAKLAAARALARLSHPSGHKVLRESPSAGGADQTAGSKQQSVCWSLAIFPALRCFIASPRGAMHRMPESSLSSRPWPRLETLRHDINYWNRTGAQQIVRRVRSSHSRLLGLESVPPVFSWSSWHRSLEHRSLLAARLLAGLGDNRGIRCCSRPRKTGQKSEPERAIAIEGVADLGNLQESPPS